MIIFNMKKIILATILLLTPTLSSAADWKIITDKSKIEFSAMQNSTKITGSFKKFDGKIDFDQTQLKNSKIAITIDTNSLTTSLSDATSTLQTLEWLGVKAFPKATFNADKFAKISDKKFSAAGILTIKDKSVPANLEFSFSEYSAKKAIAIGFLTIKRSDFQIGAKDPANAHGVQDDIVINFTINAIK